MYFTPCPTRCIQLGRTKNVRACIFLAMALLDLLNAFGVSARLHEQVIYEGILNIEYIREECLFFFFRVGLFLGYDTLDDMKWCMVWIGF